MLFMDCLRPRSTLPCAIKCYNATRRPFAALQRYPDMQLVCFAIGTAQGLGTALALPLIKLPTPPIINA